MARRKRRKSFGTRLKKWTESNSLAKTGRRIKKKVAKKAKQYKKKAVRVLKKADKATLRIEKRVTKKASRLIRKARKKISKRRLVRTFKRNKRKATKALRQAKKYLRARKRQAERARTHQELFGTADITGADIRQASGDRGASKPGEPPKLRTGRGQSSIKAELRLKGKKLESRVYVDKRIARYMAMWEFRKDGKQRPFLKPSLMNNIRLLGSEIGAELKQSIPQRSRQKARVK